jgi:superfamily II DNA or RNA helicase
MANERGIVRLSTRSGKSVIAIAAAQKLGKKTLFVVHTKSLLAQTFKEFQEKLGGNIGLIGAGGWDEGDITVATIQSLVAALKKGNAKDFLESIEYVVFDEVHHSSRSYQAVSMFLPNARWRLGLSATACISSKQNAMDSQALTGSIIYEIGMETLVEEGRIAKPKVFFVDIPYSKKGIKWTDWLDIYSKGIVTHSERNLLVAIISLRLVKRGKSVLILVEAVDHGRILQEILEPKARVQFISGSSELDERLRAQNDLEQGVAEILITTRIFAEGQDIPFLDAVIIAAGGKSPIQLFQRYGRSLTKIDGKDEGIIVDFFDNTHPRLREHSQERLRIAQDNLAFEVRQVLHQEI